ncbi:Isopentenyl-diphosphate delta-isomerase (IPP isomerase) [Alteracholeplasma palmae J233]|uniref:Isopentenyl-diphosphate delta-isomerase n=2 Tax=Acholeplasma palmae TaxID=38986 RepID=U4KRX2_ALTPJ|nr:Isopentenyl-diphosphate delta-isomerase (IPP isomerase) [Alteracholeplasma palmae J233]
MALALTQKTGTNDFDQIHFEHMSLPKYDFNDINLESCYFNRQFKYPFYINAMTGGTQKTKEANEKLAKLAKHYGLAMAVGSQKIALENKSVQDTFSVIHDIYPDGFFIGNLSANATYEDVLKASQMIHAQAFQIHLNPVQELAMQEGDRNFKHWKNNIALIAKEIKIPLIVKEVGFGMNEKTIASLINLGVSNIDVSGNGGTNFAKIENARVNRNDGFLEGFGISTVKSLKYSQKYQEKANFIASGGIRSALDIVKSLVLGACAVGLSKFFLETIQLAWDEQIKKVDELISDIKKVMILLNVNNIKDLRNVQYFD